MTPRQTGKHPLSGAVILLLLALICVSIPARSATPYRITGTVLNKLDSAPIPNAHLTATPERQCSAQSASVISTDGDSNGHFTLDLPCASTWTLTATAPNFPSQAFEAHESFSTGIALNSAHPTYDLVFHIAPSNNISGFILDESGEAVRDAKVTLLADDTIPPHSVSETQSDDRGFYEFASLAPGSFLVAVQVQPWYAVAANPIRRFTPSNPPDTPVEADLDVTYPITFFPGVADAESATPIVLSGGSTQQSDIRLTPIPAIHVRIPGGSFPLTPNRRIGSTQNSGDQIRVLPLAPPITQVSILGESTFRPTSVTTTEDGFIDLAGFAPGTYSLEPRSSRSSSGGTQTQTISLSSDTPHTVELNAVAKAAAAAEAVKPATLTGSVTLPDRSDKPSVGAMLLLIPPDAASHPIRQQSNTDGSFTFDKLTPGKYTLLAIDHGWSVNYRDTATLAPFLTRATPVTLTPGATLSRTLEAQLP